MRRIWHIGKRVFEIYAWTCLTVAAVLWVAASFHTGHLLTPDELMTSDFTWLTGGR